MRGLTLTSYLRHAISSRHLVVITKIVLQLRSGRQSCMSTSAAFDPTRDPNISFQPRIGPRLFHAKKSDAETIETGGVPRLHCYDRSSLTGELLQITALQRGSYSRSKCTKIAHPPQNARDGASRHVQQRSLNAEPFGFGASGAWWSGKPAHANGVPVISNLAGMGSDHPVNSRYRGLRAAPAKRGPWRAATRYRHGTPPGPRPRPSPASPSSALPRPSCA